MVWQIERKIAHKILDRGFERVDIPFRVKFEFEVKEKDFWSLKPSLKRSCTTSVPLKSNPNPRQTALHSAIKETGENEIVTYLSQSGFLHE